MSDRALANAEKQRDELAAEINKTNQHLDDLRKRLADTNSFILEWHRFADTGLGAATDTHEDLGYPQGSFAMSAAIAAEISKGTAATPRKNPDRGTVGAHVRQIINELKRPIPREDLFMALAARGVLIHGKDPQMVLSTMLWRMPNDFVRLAKHGYWLRDLPWAPANYSPKWSNADEIGENIDVLENEILDPSSVSEA